MFDAKHRFPNSSNLALVSDNGIVPKRELLCMRVEADHVTGAVQQKRWIKRVKVIHAGVRRQNTHNV